MKVNRTRIGSIVVAMVAAMTVLVMTGCGYGAAGGPPGEWVTVFDLATDDNFQALPVGPLTTAAAVSAAFEGTPLTDVGTLGTHVRYAIVLHEGRNALQVETLVSWSGVDVTSSFVEFTVGDEITVRGQVTVGSGQMLLNVNHAGWAPLQGWNPNISTGGTFENEFESLNVPMVNSIMAASPPNIRIRSNADTMTFILTDLVIEGYREGWAPPPSVTAGEQTGPVLVPGEAGEVTFAISANNLDIPAAWFGDANTRPVDFEDDGVVTGLPEGVSASGTITLNRSGASTGTNTLTLSVDEGADTVTGTHMVSITLFDVTGIVGLVVGPGRYVTVSDQAGFLMPGMEGNLLFFVTASNLDVTDTVIDFRTGGVVSGLPPGITASGTIRIDAAGNGQGILALSGSADTEIGSWPLSVTLGRAESPAFNLSIGRGFVEVGAQTGAVTAGTAGPITFAVNAEGLATAETIDFATAGVVRGLPAGVTASGNIVIDADGDGTGTLTLNVTATAVASRSQLTVTLGEIESDTFELRIDGVVFNMASWLVGPPPATVGWSSRPVQCNRGSGSSVVDGGINVTDRSAGHQGLDLWIAGQDGALDLDLVNYVYTLSVAGNVIGPPPVNSQIQIGVNDSPWGTLGAFSGLLEGENAAFNIDVSDLPAGLLDPVRHIRIQTNPPDSGAETGHAGMSFRITGITVTRVGPRS